MRNSIFQRIFGKLPLFGRGVEPFIWCGGVVMLLLVCCTTLLVLKRISTGSVRDHVVQTLRLSEATDEELLSAVKNAASELQTQSDDATELKRELAWSLVRHLIDRNLFSKAQRDAMLVLPAQKTDDSVIITRLLLMARALVRTGEWQTAQQYYEAAQDSYRALQQPNEVEQIIRERAVLLAAGCGASRQERITTLEGWLARLPEESSSTLGAELRVFLAKLHRSLGNLELADSILREVISQELPDPVPPSLLICHGYAHIALHEDEQAVDCLREGISKLDSDDVPSRMYRALALRDLATISLNLDHSQTALALLERVSTESSDILPEGTLFSPEIMGKRAWALYMAHDYEYALALFQRQMEVVPLDEEGLRVYPLEGIARCFLALGQPEEALPPAHECVELCEKFMAEDKPFLARLCLLLGQANEQAGRLEEAEANYSRSAGITTGDPAARMAALSACATVLMQEQKWEEAARTWEQILPLVPQQDIIQREDISEQIEKCRQQHAATSQSAPSLNNSSAQPTKSAKPASSAKTAKRSSSRRSSRSRRSRR